MAQEDQVNCLLSRWSGPDPLTNFVNTDIGNMFILSILSEARLIRFKNSLGHGLQISKSITKWKKHVETERVRYQFLPKSMFRYGCFLKCRPSMSSSKVSVGLPSESAPRRRVNFLLSAVKL